MDTSQVGEIIREQFPDVQPSRVEYLGEGYDSTAFDVNGEWVFRFPKREDVERQLLLEMRVLPVLERRSPPIPIPSYRLDGQPTPSFPRHFVGYPKLGGIPAFDVDPAAAPFRDWGKPLGQFLSWLHAFSPNEAFALGIPQQSVTTLIEEFRTDALEHFDALRGMATPASLQAWHAYLWETPNLPASASLGTVLVHGDFAAEHVLYDPASREPTGVIDWSEMSLCDPSVDFAGLFHWGGEPLVRAAFSTYEGPIDANTLHRARFIAVCRGVADIPFGIHTGRPEYVRAGLRALALCIADG